MAYIPLSRTAVNFNLKSFIPLGRSAVNSEFTFYDGLSASSLLIRPSVGLPRIPTMTSLLAEGILVRPIISTPRWEDFTVETWNDFPGITWDTFKEPSLTELKATVGIMIQLIVGHPHLYEIKSRYLSIQFIIEAQKEIMTYTAIETKKDFFIATDADVVFEDKSGLWPESMG